MTEDEYWIWLSKIKISPKAKLKLLEKYTLPKNIFNLTEAELKDILTENQIKKVLDISKKDKKLLHNEKELLDKYEIKIINMYSKEYPKAFNVIYDKPVVFYAYGNTKLLTKNIIGIVGARNCSYYGKRMAKEIAKELSKKDFVIVSGLAKGIDTYSHIGSMPNTIAVMGTGLDVIYPKDNREIAKEIVKSGGLIITEFPFGTKPEKLNFPSRNRLIAALADRLLVVEAKEKSGSLITVDFAIEYGKDVYAIPGNVTSILSKGTNNLIKEGAIPYTCIDDMEGENIN